MSRNRSTLLERLVWMSCPYWRGHGNFCLKGRLTGTRDSDFCTSRTLKHRCDYANAETLTEEQAKELDKAHNEA